MKKIKTSFPSPRYYFLFFAIVIVNPLSAQVENKYTERPDDPYIYTPRNARPTSPAYGFSGNNIFCTQVNVDNNNLNILGDAANEPSIAIDPTNPDRMVLSQNYPNPFSDHTTISYSLRKSGKVRLVIFDLNGKEIVRLVNENRPAGNFIAKWDGRDKQGNKVPGGVYYYTLFVDDAFYFIRKMTIL